jgi:hypothetical protein
MLIAMQLIQETPSWITAVVSWVALGFLAAMGLAILFLVFKEKIDLSSLISEPTGEASMSRFQLLIFTFVIAACLFLIVASKKPPEFPAEIPQGILILLGISASSYLVSKGIQASSPGGLAGQGPQVTIKGATRNNTSAGADTIQFRAEVVGLTNETVTWSVDPPLGYGRIDENGLYTPPPAPATGAPEITGKVTIKATSAEDASVTDIRNITLVASAPPVQPPPVQPPPVQPPPVQPLPVQPPPVQQPQS